MSSSSELDYGKISLSVGKPIEVQIYPGKVMSDKELTAWQGDDEVTAERRKQKDGNSRKFKVRKTKRVSIYLRDNFTCVYCELDMKGTDPRLITLDHLKPRTKGGTDDPSNLVTACLRCNCVKKDQSLAKFAGPDKARSIRRQAKKDITGHREMARSLLNPKD